jgi:histidinol dehydrogenase
MRGGARYAEPDAGDAGGRAVAQQMPAKGPRANRLARHGAVIVTSSAREAMELANLNAPEHLVVDDEKLAKQVRNAARCSLDRGRRRSPATMPSVEPRAADGWRGTRPRRTLGRRFRPPNHRAAADSHGLRRIGPSVVALARAEGLEGHARSIEIRLGRPGRVQRTRRG